MREDHRDVSEKRERFRESIMRQANEQIREIDRELEGYRASEIGRYEDDVRGSSDAFLEEERSRIEAAADHAVSARRAELRRLLFQRRGELTGELFEKAEVRLKEFAASPEYPDYLCRKAEKAKAVRGNGGKEQVVLLVMPDDLRWKERLAESCGAPCEVREDASIRLGGLRFALEQSGLEADETLDAALDAQRQWFYENAGLFLTQGGGQD